jgi:hypothetical protein
MKKGEKRALVVGVLVIAAIFIANAVMAVKFLVDQKKDIKERSIYDAVKEKENEGDSYLYIQNDFVSAEESYLEAQRLAAKLGEDYAGVKQRLAEKIASDEIQKYKQGYVLFEGRWVKRSEMTVEEKIRLEKAEQRAREIEADISTRERGMPEETWPPEEESSQETGEE